MFLAQSTRTTSSSIETWTSSSLVSCRSTPLERRFLSLFLRAKAPFKPLRLSRKSSLKLSKRRPIHLGHVPEGRPYTALFLACAYSEPRSRIDHVFQDKTLDGKPPTYQAPVVPHFEPRVELAAVGIGIHHAGLQFEDRRAVEDFYLKGVLRVVVATTVCVSICLLALFTQTLQCFRRPSQLESTFVNSTLFLCFIHVEAS